MAETIVFAVRIIMSPTCSKRDLAGRNALSATDRTIALLRSRVPLVEAAAPHIAHATHREDYGMSAPFATHNRYAPVTHEKRPHLARRRWNSAGRVPAMLAAPLEESASTARPLKARAGIAFGLAALLAASV